MSQAQNPESVAGTEGSQEAARPKVIIAGGSGFIGRRLAAVLGGSGNDVIILTRKTARAPVGPISFVLWDPEATEAADSLTALCEGARAVVNLCGESIGGPRWTPARKAALVASRVLPTRRLIEAVNLCDRPPEVFIQASGVGYYGTGTEPVDETAATGNDFLADLSRQWEASLGDLRQDVRAVTARLGVVLGKGGGALSQMLMPFRLFVGGPIASGHQWLSWIHLHDAAAILSRFIEDAESSGIYNLVAPNPVRNQAFARTAATALGRPGWMFTPRFVLKALLGEQATLVCDGQQAVSARLGDYEFLYPTLEAAFTDLL